jgi:carboxypeptidase Q
MRLKWSFLVLAFAVPSLLAEEKVDLSVVNRIRTEALQNSKVMEHMFYLTDVNGPRVTGSSGYKRAAGWVVKRAVEYKLTNPHLEAWGPFGRGWEYSKFSAHLIEPAYAPLVGFPLAWSQGTNGPMVGEPMVCHPPFCGGP